MTTKRRRSLSLTDARPHAKRESQAPLPTTNDDVHFRKPGTLTLVPQVAPRPIDYGAPMAATPPADMDTSEYTQNNVAMSAVGLLVVAPEFQVLHESWEAFDEALKVYGKATCQLYVIRSTTSVKRRNVKIAERGVKGESEGPFQAFKQSERLSMAPKGDDNEPIGDKTLIPERFRWYSKSLKCTHGWKDRHRGTRKRGSGVVRSTSCPAKMCVTLQHRGAGPENWKVVVTKHIRTHNHQLSKELFLYYTENRRIYDPELLAVVGDASDTVNVAEDNTQLAFVEANQRSGLYRLLSSNDEQNQEQTAFMGSDSSPLSSAYPNEDTGRTSKELGPLAASSSSNLVIRPRGKAGGSVAVMPPLGSMVLTPGTVPSKAIDGGGYWVPRVSVKVHASWEAFHDFIAQYSFDTAQVFRTRSTVSIAARNAKLAVSSAAKYGRNHHDVASYASYATTSPSPRLIPEDYKWFSKLLICTYGWKRRARDKGRRGSDYNDGAGPCPAMLLARMERNVDGAWHIVINRQVQKHNHRLNNYVEEISESSHVAVESIQDTTNALAASASNLTPRRSSSEPSPLIESEGIAGTNAEDIVPSSMSCREIVVRVPKLQSIFESWDDFHASLKAYSDATYQLYRTRTTSSAKGRNRKISQMKRSEDDYEKGTNQSEMDGLPNAMKATQMIPESWRWYSKTLTCTHGWKERHRGTGKRSAHGVRSTACPVKICATVQYISSSSKLEHELDSMNSSDVVASDNCWRVVVTKHIVDHNHNLSRELYQHYCENRRIYDPELLAIDASNHSAVVKRKVDQGSSDQSTVASSTSKPCMVSGEGTPSPALSTELEAGLAEAVNHAQLFESFTSNQSVRSHANEAAGTPQAIAGAPASAGIGPPSVPSVVLLPYSSTSPYLPIQAQGQEPQQQHEEHQQQTLAAFGGNGTGAHLGRSHMGGESAAALTAMAASSSSLVLLNNAGVTMMDGYPPSDSNVISVACRVHGSSTGVNLAPSKESNPKQDTHLPETHAMDSISPSAAHCTCFRIASSGTYVTIVPASEPLAPPEGNSFDVNNDAIMYTEDMDGVWQPSSHVEIEKVTLETGDFVWRVPRIVRRYPSWEAFHKTLDAYSAATFQLYRVRTTYSVRSRNVRLRQLAANRGLVVRECEEDKDANVAVEMEQEGGQGLSRAHLVPERYEWYSKTFLCTHGWKRRCRGSGQRISHNIRATECPAKLCATLQRTDGLSKWNVVVTKHLTEHNHELSAALYSQYSEVRRVRDPEVLARAEQLWRGGATRRRVFEFLKERSPTQVILMKDVHNLVQRWQAHERRPRQDENDAENVETKQQTGQNTPLDVATSQDEDTDTWL